MSGQVRSLIRPDGSRIGWRVVGGGETGAAMPDTAGRLRTVLFFHATLSSGLQLEPLATRSADLGSMRVILVDRRGVGASHAPRAARSDLTDRPSVRVPIGTHVDDALAVLDVEGIDRAALFGHSYGANVALELAARRPDRVEAVVGWEPPYTALAVEPYRTWLDGLRDEALEQLDATGPAAAAEAILRRISGDAAWDRLSPRARDLLAADGEAATSDVEQRGLDPDGLRRIAAPTTFLVSDASGGFYPLVSQALLDRLPSARIVRLGGLSHMAPVTDPDQVAPALADALTAVPARD